MSEPEYVQLNRANWDDRAPLHATSPDYEVERFVADPDHLSAVVRYDLPRLGDISGLDAVHLQCHIGTDTLSLHRLGARMTGLDLSPASLDEARRLAERTGAAIRYVESEVTRATEVLEPGSFDLVYTGIGAIGWLPRIDDWAATVAALLRPGGRLFIREGHPMMWALDESRAEALTVGYDYFEREEPLVFETSETYVAVEGEITATVTHEWNHGLGEILGAVLAHGLEITGFEEHDSVPWLALPGQMTGPDARGEFTLIDERPRIPLSFTLQAVKRG